MFIEILGMCIYNSRSKKDYANLNPTNWLGAQQGTDGYPKQDKNLRWFCIGGGEDSNFKPSALELYGVNMQT